MHCQAFGEEPAKVIFIPIDFNSYFFKNQDLLVLKISLSAKPFGEK